MQSLVLAQSQTSKVRISQNSLSNARMALFVSMSLLCWLFKPAALCHCLAHKPFALVHFQLLPFFIEASSVNFYISVFITFFSPTLMMSSMFSESGHFNLANLNADCLQLIFDRLPVSDGLHLGQTCRTLYGHFKQSCRNTTSVTLFKGSRNMIQQYKADFGKVQRKEEGELFMKAKRIEIELPLSLFEDQRQKVGPEQLMSLTYIQQIFANFPNLKHLQLGANFHEDDFARLISGLNSLSHLTTLHLALRFHNIRYDPETQFWRILSQLKPPALLHLALSLDGEAFIFERQSEILLPKLSKLTSFGLFYDRPYAPFGTICSLVKKISLRAPQLVPGKGARFGSSFTYGSKGSVKAFEQKKARVDNLLPYFTHLEVFFYWSDFPNFYNAQDTEGEEAAEAQLRPFSERAMRTLFTFLPQLINLKSIFLKLNCSMEACADYPGILAALAKLAHLEAISFDFSENIKMESGFKWPRSVLTILPNIRTFLVNYNNEEYTDVVDQFDVPYVFPGLATFACFFAQQHPFCTFTCFESFTAEKKLEHLQICGQRLTRGLSKLPATVQKKVSFHFCPGGTYFSSLEKLMAGQFDLTSVSMLISKTLPVFTLSKHGLGSHLQDE